MRCPRLGIWYPRSRILQRGHSERSVWGTFGRGDKQNGRHRREASLGACITPHLEVMLICLDILPQAWIFILEVRPSRPYLGTYTADSEFAGAGDRARWSRVILDHPGLSG
jgi:hypothetical protein